MALEGGGWGVAQAVRAAMAARLKALRHTPIFKDFWPKNLIDTAQGAIKLIVFIEKTPVQFTSRAQ
jgi:hypothetical protein